MTTNNSHQVAIDTVQTLNPTQVYTLASGFKVKLKVVPQVTIQKAMEKIPMPKPPLVSREDGVSFPNENDPDYLAAIDLANQKKNEVAVDVALLLGVELVDIIPPTDSAEFNDWLAELSYLNVITDDEIKQIKENNHFKKLMWLKHKVLSVPDANAIVPMCINAGLTDEQLKLFRPHAQR